MAATALPPGVAVRGWERRDGTVTESYTVRFKDADGTKRRRSFDTLDDALDFLAKRRSAKRWRPEELRQEQARRLTLGEFFERWWIDHAVVELKRSTLSCTAACGRRTPSRGLRGSRSPRSTRAAW